ncbi:MAG: PQQ-dependent sugar dehydrogenase [Flavobacteriales bacterium]|nr:PQQ-dependent sugar dehydrogenase [Flavobacteriales bacterium]
MRHAHRFGTCFLFHCHGRYGPITGLHSACSWAEGFFDPTDIAHAGDARLFIAQQNGRVLIVTDSNTVSPAAFLDISSKVVFNAEQGLLGIAFDPDYTTNGLFYVHYVADDSLGHRSVIARYSVSTTDPDQADPASEEVIYTWPQWSDQHKGGDLAFAPDGTLFITFGDGSTGGDPLNASQDLSNPLGDIIRIRPEIDSTYSIPADNPFAQASGDTLPEIWASGLRNPFRIAVDPVGNSLWIGDVGQGGFEEVNRWPLDDNSGPNFGWRCREGFVDFNFTLCDSDAVYVPPVTVQANILNGGSWCAMMGGRVYRGTQYPRLAGRYFFTDYCSGQFRSLLPGSLGSWQEDVLLQSGPLGLVCIDEGADGELYAISNFGGKLYKIKDACPMPMPTIIVAGDSLICSAALGYAWSVDGALIPGADQQVLYPATVGNYSVLADLGPGCILASDTVLFQPVSIAEGNASSNFIVYPDPANDAFNVSWDQRTAGTVSMDLLDPLGRPVMHRSLSVGRAALDVAGLSAGLYIVRLTFPDGVVAQRRIRLL